MLMYNISLKNHNSNISSTGKHGVNVKNMRRGRAKCLKLKKQLNILENMLIPFVVR